jgi:hypothetical protein
MTSGRQCHMFARPSRCMCKPVSLGVRPTAQILLLSIQPQITTWWLFVLCVHALHGRLALQLWFGSVFRVCCCLLYPRICLVHTLDKSQVCPANQEYGLCPVM